MQAIQRAAMLSRVSTTARSACAWWLDEIRGMVPDRLKRLGARRRKQVLLDVSPQMVVVAEVNGSTTRTIAELDVDASEVEYANVVSQIPRRSAKAVTLRLPAHSVLNRQIALPAALEPTLPDALRFEVERQTPYNTTDVYFDYRIVARHRDTQTMDVELSVVDRQVVDQAMTAARRFGLQPSAVSVDDRHDWPPSINFLPNKSTGENAWTKLQYILAGLAFMLCAAATVVMLNREAREVGQLTASVNEVRQEAAKAVELRDEIERLVSQSQYLDRKKMQPSIMFILRELTVLLPDDAWIVEFDANGAAGRISGYAKDASALIGILDNSDLFRNVSFVSPVMHDQGGQQRFNIRFDAAEDGAK